VATYARCDGIFNNDFTKESSCEKMWKSVKIWQKYDHEFVVSLFLPTLHVYSDLWIWVYIRCIYVHTRIYPTYQCCKCTLANIWGIFLIKVIKYLMLPDCRIVRYDSYPNVSVGCTVDGCCPCFFASCWTLSFLSVIDIIHVYCPGLVFSSGFRHFSFNDIPLRIFFPIMCPKHGNFNLLTV